MSFCHSKHGDNVSLLACVCVDPVIHSVQDVSLFGACVYQGLGTSVTLFISCVFCNVFSVGL